MARKSITITLPEALISTIDEAAEHAGLNRSQYIESLMKSGRDEVGIDEDFVKTTEVRGTTKAVFEFFPTFFAEKNPSATFDMKRERILRMYVRATPEELKQSAGHRGGMALTLEGATKKALL